MISRWEYIKKTIVIYWLLGTYLNVWQNEGMNTLWKSQFWPCETREKSEKNLKNHDFDGASACSLFSDSRQRRMEECRTSSLHWRDRVPGHTPPQASSLPECNTSTFDRLLMGLQTKMIINFRPPFEKAWNGFQYFQPPLHEATNKNSSHQSR